MQKTKILFFVPQLVGGGAEKVNMNIMKILDNDIFDVHLVVTTIMGSVYQKIPDSVTLHDLDTPKTIFSIPKLRKFIRQLNPDIVFSSLIRGHIAINLALLGIRKKPFTIFRSPNSPKLLLKYNQTDFKERLLLKNAYRRADVVVAQTPEMKDEIIEYYGIDKQRIKVIFNPIDRDEIDEKIKNITNPFESDNINVVAAGRIIYQKGFDILIKSFKYVIKQNPLFRLYIIGEDPIGENGTGEIENLQKLIKELNLTEYVSFLGYQNNPYQYFYFSDLYVLASRWEGLPNTVLENLYLHKPVVSTRCIPFMSSLIQEGKNGLLVDVDDIKGLSNAILNYKNLTFEFMDSRNVKKDVNNFFRNIRIEV